MVDVIGGPKRAYLCHEPLNHNRSVRLVAMDSGTRQPVPGLTEVIYDIMNDEHIDNAYYSLLSAARRLGYELQLHTKGECHGET